MTIHFSYFLFDLLVWSLSGAVLGYWIASIERRSHTRKMSIVYAIVSVCLGCYSVLDGGLPSAGFAFVDTFFVFAILSAISLVQSSEARLKVQEFILKSYHHIVLSTHILRGGELHGNSR